MNKGVVVVGASLGGLVAAAELRQLGHDVTIVEKSNSVGGLYNKIDTPFGVQELGMHVLYVNKSQFQHLCDIFGEEVFNVMEGCNVDIGSCVNFGSVFFDSLYPNVLGHPDESTIFAEIAEGTGNRGPGANAREEAVRRFGNTGGNNIVAPILEKLWRIDSAKLTRHALHCFFDLRRMVVCEKSQADLLKDDPWLDEVVANPIQSKPKGEIFGGRVGLTFKSEHQNLAERFSAWASRVGVNVEFGKQISVDDECLMVEGTAVHDICDACIVALPMHSLAGAVIEQADQIELSIYYMQLAKKIGKQFPAYYLLCHDSRYKSSRIVNYDAYHQENSEAPSSVLAVEVVHPIGEAPTKEEIGEEVVSIFPSIEITDSIKLERAVRVCLPTKKNNGLLTTVKNQIESHFKSIPVYFTGMRTDTGIFFSHHTIGLAHDSALECSKRLL